MDIIGWLTTVVGSLPVALIWGLGALFAFTESGLGLGFFFPGETIVLLLSAALGSPWSAVALFAFVVVGCSLGDHVGYLLGRRFGSSFRNTKLIRRVGVTNWDRAVGVLEKRGAAAVFLTRLVPVIRTLTPAAAGVARIPYRAFLPASLGGAMTWAAVYVGIGYLARTSIEAVQKYLGTAGYVLLGGAAVVVVILLVVRAVRAPGAQPAEVVAPSTNDESAAPGYLAALHSDLFRQDDWKTIPNAITVLRLALLPVFAGFMIAQLWWGALGVVAVIFFTDWLDGFVARRTHTVSALGTWLDPVADRLTVVVVVVSFVAAHLVPWQTLAILLVPDVLLGLGAVVAFRGSPAVPVTWAGKVRTAAIFVGLLGVLVGSALGPDLRLVVGLGFVVYLFGLIGHYIAAVQYARAMLAKWQRRVVSA